jgi:hypothetical protein
MEGIKEHLQRKTKASYRSAYHSKKGRIYILPLLLSRGLLYTGRWRKKYLSQRSSFSPECIVNAMFAQAWAVAVVMGMMMPLESYQKARLETCGLTTEGSTLTGCYAKTYTERRAYHVCCPLLLERWSDPCSTLSNIPAGRGRCSCPPWLVARRDGAKQPLRFVVGASRKVHLVHIATIAAVPDKQAP